MVQQRSNGGRKSNVLKAQIHYQKAEFVRNDVVFFRKSWNDKDWRDVQLYPTGEILYRTENRREDRNESCGAAKRIFKKLKLFLFQYKTNLSIQLDYLSKTSEVNQYSF